MSRDDTRSAMLRLLRRGSITMGEAARWAGVPRVVVLRWCRAAGFDAVKAREKSLARQVAWSLGQSEKRVDRAGRDRTFRMVAEQQAEAAYSDWQPGSVDIDDEST